MVPGRPHHFGPVDDPLVGHARLRAENRRREGPRCRCSSHWPALSHSRQTARTSDQGVVRLVGKSCWTFGRMNRMPVDMPDDGWKQQLARALPESRPGARLAAWLSAYREFE